MNVNYFIVICVSKHKWYDLTIGEIYNVTEYEPMNPDKSNKLYRTDNNKYYPIELVQALCKCSIHNNRTIQRTTT
jgi:hypothetical protein